MKGIAPCAQLGLTPAHFSARWAAEKAGHRAFDLRSRFLRWFGGPIRPGNTPGRNIAEAQTISSLKIISGPEPASVDVL